MSHEELGVARILHGTSGTLKEVHDLMRQTAWFSAAIGAWLIIVPLAFGFGTDGSIRANDITLGIILVGLPFWIVPAENRAPGGWIMMLCGVWLIVSPFLVGYRHAAAATWNDIAAGIMTVIVARLVVLDATARPANARR